MIVRCQTDLVNRKKAKFVFVINLITRTNKSEEREGSFFLELCIDLCQENETYLRYGFRFNDYFRIF